MRADASLWLNYGDCYACQKNGRPAAEVEGDDRTFRDKPFSTVTDVHRKNGQPRLAGPNRSPQINLKPKDLVGMPWRLALALQADGWWLRSDIVWSKVNPMPESVTDRPTRSHEYLFLLAKSEKYFMDMDAIREAATYGYCETVKGRFNGRSANGEHNSRTIVPGDGSTGRNRRTVWTIPTQATPEAHFATFPEALVEPCILAGTSERGVCPTCGAPWERVTEKESRPGSSPARNDAESLRYTGNGDRNDAESGRSHSVSRTVTWRPTCSHPHTEAELLPALVLDCFAGSGTVSRVASRLGRRSIGIELSEEYVEKIARKRTSQGSLGL